MPNAQPRATIVGKVFVKVVMFVHTVKDQDAWHRGINKRYHVVIVIRLSIGEY